MGLMIFAGGVAESTLIGCDSLLNLLSPAVNGYSETEKKEGTVRDKEHRRCSLESST